jgi:ABC-type dipeptide/oligopeptide/nickel transport system permease subunit
MNHSKVTLGAGVLVGAFVLIAVLAPFIAGDSSSTSLFPLIKHGPETVDIMNAQILEAPSKIHFLGTDHIGRDVFARLV